jgi:hypothetical protein
MRAILVSSILLGNTAALSAATTPFFDSFDSYSLPGDPTPTGFTEETSGQWTVQPAGGGQDYQNAISSTGSISSALSVTSSSGVGFPALPGNAFTMSTNFTIDALTVSGSTLSTAFVGFAALATDPNYAFTTNPRYQVSYILDDDGINPTGKLLLSEFNTGDHAIDAASAAALPVATGILYTLTASGSYSGGNLTLSATLSSTGGSISVSDVDTVGVLTGTNYGYLDRVFATRDLAYWRQILDEAGITFGIVAETADIADDEQALAAGHLVPFTDADYMTINSPIEIRGQEKVPPRRAPALGEHSAAVLRDAGYGESEIAALREAGVIG